MDLDLLNETEHHMYYANVCWWGCWWYGQGKPAKGNCCSAMQSVHTKVIFSMCVRLDVRRVFGEAKLHCRDMESSSFEPVWLCAARTHTRTHAILTPSAHLSCHRIACWNARVTDFLSKWANDSATSETNEWNADFVTIIQLSVVIIGGIIFLLLKSIAPRHRTYGVRRHHRNHKMQRICV